MQCTGFFVHLSVAVKFANIGKTIADGCGGSKRGRVSARQQDQSHPPSTSLAKLPRLAKPARRGASPQSRVAIKLKTERQDSKPLSHKMRKQGGAPLVPPNNLDPFARRWYTWLLFARTPLMNNIVAMVLLLSCGNGLAATRKNTPKDTGLRFEVSFPKESSSTPLDGRILLLISNNNDQEPRFQLSYNTTESQQVFGV